MDQFSNLQQITALTKQTQEQLPVRLFLTTSPGLEKIVRHELISRLAQQNESAKKIEINPFGISGQLWIESTNYTTLYSTALKLRSINDVFLPLNLFSLPNIGAIDHIENMCAQLNVKSMETAKSFRVTCRRVGEHTFNSIDVQRRAGAALWRRYRTTVDLKNFEIDIRIYIYKANCLISLPLTTKALSNRLDRVFQPRTAIRSSVAYALLHFARIDSNSKSSLLDPFCGSGTILFEAADYSKKLILYGSDINQHVIIGAQKNAQALGFEQRISFTQCDARELNQIYLSKQFDHIVCNPPYGFRFGKHLDFNRFYIRLLQQFWYRLAPNGTATLIAFSQHELKRAIRLTGLFKVFEQQRIQVGNFKPYIFALERVNPHKKT